MNATPLLIKRYVRIRSIHDTVGAYSIGHNSLSLQFNLAVIVTLELLMAQPTQEDPDEFRYALSFRHTVRFT